MIYFPTMHNIGPGLGPEVQDEVHRLRDERFNVGAGRILLDSHIAVDSSVRVAEAIGDTVINRAALTLVGSGVVQALRFVRRFAGSH